MREETTLLVLCGAPKGACSCDGPAKDAPLPPPPPSPVVKVGGVKVCAWVCVSVCGGVLDNGMRGGPRGIAQGMLVCLLVAFPNTHTHTLHKPRIGGGGSGPCKFSTLSGKEGSEGKLGWASRDEALQRRDSHRGRHRPDVEVDDAAQ